MTGAACAGGVRVATRVKNNDHLERVSVVCFLRVTANSITRSDDWKKPFAQGAVDKTAIGGVVIAEW